ncbi:hypothetical protein CANCADRAFT_113198 [Tortispora caseinolytica NRRL Y-17796]|uniref:Trafficking protein particle complex II-specific subunit 65 IgD3 domain-containing protein n=1 Tax=Tortispora caseinolytica NRRL Y-17796 TaxID=767744 RepID=A0A1E4TGP6_9ASCO|nr:hypothetical protein CANCADRAFT_113198 [Tortispora caseinolytica NRRL Y-17796]
MASLSFDPPLPSPIFFDQNIQATLVLKCPVTDQVLSDLSNHVCIAVDCQIIDKSDSNQEAESVLFTQLDSSNLKESLQVENSYHLVYVFSMSIPASSGQLRSPWFVFNGTAAVRSDTGSAVSGTKNNALLVPPVLAQSANLLEPLSNVTKIHPYVPASRLVDTSLGINESGVSSVSSSAIPRLMRMQCPILSIEHPVYATSFLQFRPQSLPTKSPDGLLRQLNYGVVTLEALGVPHKYVLFKSIQVSTKTPGISVIAPSQQLPIVLRSRDILSLLFEFSSDDIPLDPILTLIQVSAIPLESYIDDFSNLPESLIHSRWEINVDFSPITHPHHTKLNQFQRPRSLNVANPPLKPALQNRHSSSSPVRQSLKRVSIARPITSIMEGTADLQSKDLFVKVWGPLEMKVGVPVSWKVLILNRTHASKRLSISIAPHRTLDKLLPQTPDIRPHVDHATLQYLHEAIVPTHPSVVAVDNAIRLPILTTGMSHQTHIRFMALKPGPCYIEGIIVTDLSSGTALRCGRTALVMAK